LLGVPDDLRPAIGGVLHPGELLHVADLSFLFPHDVGDSSIGSRVAIGAGSVVMVVDGDAFHGGKLLMRGGAAVG